MKKIFMINLNKAQYLLLVCKTAGLSDMILSGMKLN